MFFIALIIFHVLVCVALIVVVLLQSSKGQGLAGSAFGGGGGVSGAVFGGRGAGTFLSKATTILAVLFMINSIGLAFMSSNRSGRVELEPGQTESVITREAQRAREQAMQQQQQQQQPGDSLLNLDVQPVDPQGGSEDGGQ